MTTSYTSLLGLALPVTGELQGTWGDTVNSYITQYLDSAVAGAQTISGSQTAVTLSVTNGSALTQVGSGATGSAQYQIINCTGNPAGLLTITAPAASKVYLILNSTSTSQSVKIVGTGPTTGVTVISGEKALVAWNGSDFVKVASTAAAGGSNTQVQFNNNGVLAGSASLTWDGTYLTAGSIKDSALTSGRVTYAGASGLLQDSANLTFDGTTLSTNGLTASGTVTLSGGTANGVLYLNGSKVATSGSALTFDGTIFANTAGSLQSGTNVRVGIGVNTGQVYFNNTDVGVWRGDANSLSAGAYLNLGGYSGIVFATSATAIGSQTEGMRLTSTGLGIGTSSPGAKLDVVNGFIRVNEDGAGTKVITIRSNYAGVDPAINVTTNNSLLLMTNNTIQATLSASGNLGIGTSSPATRLSVDNTRSDTAGTGWFTYTDAAITSGKRGMRVDTNNNYWFDYYNGSSWSGQMVLDSSGNLGIGTSSPSNKLHVAGTTRIARSTDANQYGTISIETGNVNYDARGSINQVWLNAGTEQMRLDTSGNLGIGTSSPGSKLQVNSTGVAVAKLVDTSATGYSGLTFGGTGTQNYAIGMGGPSETAFGVANKWFLYDGLAGLMRMVVDSSGNVGIGTSSPNSPAGSTQTTLHISNSTAGKSPGIHITNGDTGTAAGDGTLIFVGDAASTGTTSFNIYNQESSPICFFNATAEKMRLDSAGNLGLGVTPSPLSVSGRVVEIGFNGNSIQGVSDGTSITGNAYYDGGWKYGYTGASSYYAVSAGYHRWYIAPSGTAGNAITFTQAMTLDASGNLGVGTTSPYGRFNSSGSNAAGYIIGAFDNTASNGYTRLDLRIGASGANGVATIKYAPGIFMQIGPDLNDTTTPLVFATNNATERARIDTSGNLLVGDTTSSGRLTVKRSTDGTIGYFDGSTTQFRIDVASSTISLNAQNGTGAMAFQTNGTERMRLDSSGNLGLGVTPSAWGGTFVAYQAKNGYLSGYSNRVYVGANNYYDGSNNIYIASDYATRYYQNAGQHIWETSASGTAGNAITFTQAMTLTAAGKLGIGNTNPGEVLDVTGNISLGSGTSGSITINGAGGTGACTLNILGGGSGNPSWDIGTYSSPSAFTFGYTTGGTRTERARIDSSGNLLVGTTSASGKISIGGSGANRISFAGPTGTMYVGYDGATDALQVASNTYVRFQTGSSYGEAARIDSSGNLLIGATSSVAGKLQISNGTITEVDGYFVGSVAYQGTTSNHSIAFLTNNNEAARIDTSGNLLVGTTSLSGSERLNVTGSSSSFIAQFINSNASPQGFTTYYSAAAPNGAANYFYRAQDNAAVRVDIYSNGGIGNYQANNTNLSDRREKKDFAPAKSYLETICAIPVQTFKYIDQSDEQKTLGVVAQDVQAVAPELVSETDWSTEKDGSKMRLSIYQTDLQYALMKCIQELKAEVDSLKSQLKGA